MSVPVDTGKPCCARLDGGGWCLLHDGHSGDHIDRPRTYVITVGGQRTKRQER